LADQTSTHPTATRPRRLMQIAIWSAVGLICVLGAAVASRRGDSSKAAAKAAPKVPVVTAAAKTGDIGVYLDAIGTVTPEHTASITSQVTGLVVGVHYTEGQLVKRGDPLVDIDPRPYRATLLQAQGALERDLNLLGQAKMDEDRYRAAWESNSIAKQQLDDQEKLVLQDQGVVRNDSGTVEYDQVQLAYCHITAPIAGRVGLRLVDPGNVVQASGSTTLAVVAQLDPITVIFTIPEDNLIDVQPRLRAGATLSVDAFDRTGQRKLATGKLLTLDNEINTTTGTVQGRALFDNKDELLFPNQFVNTRLLVNTLHGVTLVPASAIQQNGQTSFVYVIQANVAHMRNVTPGVTNAGLTEVKGVQPGEVVATSSFDKLQDNAAVFVATKPPTGDTTRSVAP
jgi:membrane fusion protein, multidrug efflux system